jgi:hypothetical protein
VQGIQCQDDSASAVAKPFKHGPTPARI